MKKVIKVEDLDCANCAAKVEKGIKALEGVNSASVSFMAQKIVVDVTDERAATIIDDIKAIAKKVEPDMKVLG